MNKFFFLLFIAWGWNSGQSSPTSTKDFKKFVVIRVSGDEKNEAGLSTYIVYCFTCLFTLMWYLSSYFMEAVHKIYIHK